MITHSKAGEFRQVNLIDRVDKRNQRDQRIGLENSAVKIVYIKMIMIHYMLFHLSVLIKIARLGERIGLSWGKLRSRIVLSGPFGCSAFFDFRQRAVHGKCLPGRDIVGEYLPVTRQINISDVSRLPANLPIPPFHQFLNLFLFLYVVKKFQDTIVKAVGVGDCICSREHCGGA